MNLGLTIKNEYFRLLATISQLQRTQTPPHHPANRRVYYLPVTIG
jgi:hypothetical protein